VDQQLAAQFSRSGLHDFDDYLDATRSFRALLAALLIFARSAIRQYFRNAIHASLVPHDARLPGGSNRTSRAACLSLSLE